MNNVLTLKRLVCKHCGAELSGLSDSITFQCKTCYRYFIITPEGLKDIAVYTAIGKEQYKKQPLMLPFWLVEVDRKLLRKEIEKSLSELRKLNSSIAKTRLEKNPEDENNILSWNLHTGTEKLHAMANTSSHRSIPGSREIEYLLSTIESFKSFFIYIPAFISRNPFAYLKIGKLLTKKQPSFEIEQSTLPGKPVMCVLQQDEAVELIDFIFFATLPSSILKCGDFLNPISLKVSGSPRLVLFPFQKRTNSLFSLIGEFSVSSSLIVNVT
ncbi:hypothetical protein J7M07_02715 [bacterium]|nr:hypothetical protein [bacterium]